MTSSFLHLDEKLKLHLSETRQKIFSDRQIYMYKSDIKTVAFTQCDRSACILFRLWPVSERFRRNISWSSPSLCLFFKKNIPKRWNNFRFPVTGGLLKSLTASLDVLTAPKLVCRARKRRRKGTSLWPRICGH